MDIFFIFLITIVVWLYLKKTQEARFIKRVKPKQEQRLDKLYDKFKDRFSNSNEGALPASVDRVYCIYSDKRKDYIQNQFTRFNLNVTYFKGIFPDDLTLDDYRTLSCTEERFCKIHKKNTKLPVQLSFVTCMMDAIKHGYKTIMVFEDDIVVNVDMDTLNESLKEFKKSSYEMFYMGYCWMSCNQNFDKDKHNYIVGVPNEKPLCHHAIAMKTDNFKSIIDYIFPMVQTKDAKFRKYYKTFNTQVCVPTFSYFDQDRATFGTMNENYQTTHKTCDLS